MDQDELEKRRKARQEARLQRQNRQKQTILKLGIAAVALILCGVLIFVLSRPGSPDPEPPVSTQEDTLPTDTSPDATPTAGETTEAAAQTVIHLAAAGDLNITESVVDSGGAEYDYAETFMDVLPLLAQADITTVNFEGNFCGAPYGIDRSAPEGIAKALASAGVDLVQLANSYTIYKGMDGLSATISAVRAAGMEPVGAYASNDEAKAAKGYTIRVVNGVKIAFVAFTKGMDGMALPAGNESCVNLLYTDYASDYQKVDKEGITAVLNAAARAKPDVTVALLHWGSEFNNTISQTQNEICTLLQENGVDAIIGTHSHYVQEMVFDADAGTFVAYSLGDFCGDASRAGTEYSVVLDLEITKDNKSGNTKITGYFYTPIFTVKEEGKPLRIMRIQEAISAFDGGYIGKVNQETYDAMKYALERIEERTKPKTEETKTED